MNKKIIIGISIFIISLFLFSAVGRSAEEFTKFYFSEELKPGHEVKWNVKALELTGDFQKEMYFDIGDYNLTQGDTIIIKVEADPNTLPQPYGWQEEDWFDVYINDILVYDNSSEFYSDMEDTADDDTYLMLPVWFIFPSQFENSTGKYNVHELIYNELRTFENHTSESYTETYSPYTNYYEYKFDFWPELESDAVSVNLNIFFNVTIVDSVNNEVYYINSWMKIIFRINKDGIADQYYMNAKVESRMPADASLSVTLQEDDGLEVGNGTVEFSVVRQGYTPPATAGGGGENTLVIPYPLIAPIVGIFAIGTVILRRKRN